jgi:PBP1b-binding outer membrane lipoprotein LpoB
MKKLMVILIAALVLSSCASTQQAGNLSYADVSLNFSSDEFDIVSLDSVSARATSFFGV